MDVYTKKIDNIKDKETIQTEMKKNFKISTKKEIQDFLKLSYINTNKIKS